MDLPPPNHHDLLSSFLDIAVGLPADTARQFLDVTGWNLREAISLYYATQPPPPPVVVPHDEPQPAEDSMGISDAENDEIDDDSRNRGATNLADLYRPPYALMFYGTFENLKREGEKRDKWALVNVQSETEFASHVLNRDTWANESVAEIIKTSFVFWQYDANQTDEGKKVCTYYNLNSLPAVLVIDPVTGRNMMSWTGPVQPNPTSLLESLQPFLDETPLVYLARKCNNRVNAVNNGVTETEIEIEKEEDKNENIVRYPDLPEEPLLGDANLVCRVGVRLPDGRRLQRKFLRSDPVQLLWSFCHSQVGEADRTKPFRLTVAVPGTSKVVLEYESNLSFEESGIGNSMITLTWDS